MNSINSINSQSTHIKRPGIIIFLVMLYITIDLLSNVLVLKVVKLGFFLQPGGIFIYPILFIMGDIIAEVYGYKLARLILIFDVICDFTFAFFAYLIIQLPSPSNWHNQHAYNVILGHLLSINLDISIAMLIGGIVNAYLITKWKKLLKGRRFWLRSIGSSAIGEAIMLVIGASLIFMGKMTPHQIMILIISDYSFRMLYAIFGAFPANFLVNILKVYEGHLQQPKNKLATFNPFNIDQYK